MPAQGWLWLDGVEVLNNSRTLANLEGSINGIAFTRYTDPCPGFSLDPVSDPQWADLDYTSPATAPWHAAQIPYSDDFLGFHVETFTFNSPVSRSVNERGLVAGGANLGRVHRSHREMQVEVLLLATSDAGMQYGFDWLASQLAPPDPCATSTALIRLSCPSTSFPANDLWELREVGVIDGLEWGDSPFKYAGCVARRASFTLAAGDPCRYSTVVTTPVDRESFDLNTGGDCGTASTPLDFACPTNGLRDQRSCAVIPSIPLGSYAVSFGIEAGPDGAAATLVRGAYNPQFKHIDGLTAAAGQYVSVTGLTNLNTRTSMLMAAAVRAADWSPAVGGGIFGHHSGVQAACSLSLLSDGRLQASVRQSNGTLRTATSTVAVPYLDGDVGWVAAFIDSVTKTATFYTSESGLEVAFDDLVGDQLGAASVAFAAWDGTWLSSTTAVVGAISTSDAGFNGEIYRAYALGNGSTIAFAPDIQDQAPGATTWVDGRGKTWTATGSGVDISEPGGAYNCGDERLDIEFEAVVCRLAADEKFWIDSTDRRVWFDEGDGVWVDGTAKMWLRGSQLEHFFAFRSPDEDFLVWMEPATLQGFSTTQAYTISYQARVCQ